MHGLLYERLHPEVPLWQSGSLASQSQRLAYPIDCSCRTSVRTIQGALMTDAAAERQRVRGLIERAAVVMLMNIDEHDTHVGRPMLPLFIQDDPHIFFLTHQSSRKVMQLAARPQVGLTIISANCYLVITGSAHISRDPELIGRLWSPTYRA